MATTIKKVSLVSSNIICVYVAYALAADDDLVIETKREALEIIIVELAYKVIQRFKHRIDIDPQKITDSWEGKDVCTKYKGFVCDTHPKYKEPAVAGVDFNGYNLGGSKFSLNDFFEQLEDLAIFHANSNFFAGAIPKTSRFKYLYEIDVSNNKLYGQFPMEVLNVKNLSFLDLRFNKFYGAIPSGLFDYLKLDALFINNNHFTQELPQNLGSTTALYITFANNKFTGPIPKSIGEAKYLLEILFLNNKLSGCLPYEIGNLRNLTVFDASSNWLTGPIPHSFGCLASMQFLNLTGNQFYGTVPEMVCKLPNLKKLSLSDNYFTQVGSECRKMIMKKKIDVRMNCILDLPNQKSAEECRKFFSKKRNCSEQKTMNLIPCKNNGDHLWNATAETLSDQISTVPASAPRTYDALIPHKL
ncbi:hypothetical protein EZV62_011247 [Acer yangbiense]|uniref:Leucine-rich repeat-containing N-terminal plant-type domain-containing protein n=1 Tax=Acer yangbiense TaxID=1000413 RepID=A0A5C7I3Z3_9ROSI|nr:hypothetical protein EZV62_011247 [Acer yangbiense]